MPAVEMLARVLQRVIISASLGQNKGRFWYLRVREVNAQRERGRRGSGVVAIHPSSPQIMRRFSPSPHQYRARGSTGALGWVRWMHMGEMR
jgi:hypothetical protein